MFRLCLPLFFLDSSTIRLLRFPGLTSPWLCCDVALGCFVALRLRFGFVLLRVRFPADLVVLGDSQSDFIVDFVFALIRFALRLFAPALIWIRSVWLPGCGFASDRSHISGRYLKQFQ